MQRQLGQCLADGRQQQLTPDFQAAAQHLRSYFQ
jgi:hypothetical protein